MMRIPEGRWSAIIHSWIPAGRRKRRRPRRSWREGVTEAMEKGGMGAEDAQIVNLIHILVFSFSKTIVILYFHLRLSITHYHHCMACFRLLVQFTLRFKI